MIISFPVLISETTDKDILPYLLKTIERRFALNYIPILQDIIKKEIAQQFDDKKCIEGVILRETDEPNVNEEELMESLIGIQIIQSESNKINSDQPYFITLRVVTEGRVTQDYIFGFKALALVTNNAFDIFKDELERSTYAMTRLARRMFGDSFIWKMTSWYRKVFDRHNMKGRKFETEKVLFSEDKERLVILSVNDLQREEFEHSDPDDTPLSSDNLADSRWSTLYLDDPLNKKVYSWDEKSPKFSSIMSYDMLYKNILGVLPEEIDKAKQRNTSLFSKRAPASYLAKQVYGKRR